MIWPVADTNAEDRDAWFGGLTCRALAYVEEDWLHRIRTMTLHRYLMPPETFEDIGDTGMWLSRSPVVPLELYSLNNLPAEIDGEGVFLRSLPRLIPLKEIWNTTFHVSGVRLRNAQDWTERTRRDIAPELDS